MPSVCFWRIVELTDTELTELPALKEDFLHPEGPGWNGRKELSITDGATGS